MGYNLTGRMEVNEFGMKRELSDVKVTQNDAAELQAPQWRIKGWSPSPHKGK